MYYQLKYFDNVFEYAYYSYLQYIKTNYQVYFRIFWINIKNFLSLLRDLLSSGGKNAAQE